MEWAQPHPALAAAFECYLFRNDVENVDAVENLSFLQFEVAQRRGLTLEERLPPTAGANGTPTGQSKNSYITKSMISLGR